MHNKKFDFTKQQQITLVNGGSFFGTSAVEEKDIPRMQFLDGGTGINFEQLFGDILSSNGRTGIGGKPLRDVLENFYTPEKITDSESKELYDFIYEKLSERFPDMIAPGCYPPGILLGATWNKDVIYEVGTALGQEASAYGVNVLLGTPNINLHRDIRNGRLFEGYSEDPYLVCALAPSLVKGVQENGVAANVKHFAANHQETNRKNINEYISERALNELYFPGFEACVKAGAATVMSAYNQINGVPCTENRYMLEELLRDTWGFDGVVMSDWGAVVNEYKAVNAGNDLNMPGPVAPETLTKALEKGQLSEECLEVSANRVARLALKYSKKASGTIDVEKTNETAYNAAAEGIVLLKNEKNTMPLNKQSRIALCGRLAKELLTCGEGSAGVITNRNVSFEKCLDDRFEEVIYGNINDYTDTLIYVYSLEGKEGNDRKDILIEKEVMEEINILTDAADNRGMKKVLILNVCAPVSLEGIHEKFDSIFCVFLPGMQGAKALADCICGNVNPSGKLPVTWPARIEDMPTYLSFPGDGMQVNYGEGIFVGYRWYDARKIKPLYPFGYGLSYTEFDIESVESDNDMFTDCVNISVNVKNTGGMAGKTVVQIYVSDIESTLTKPVRELKAFEKICLNAGESKKITFTLDKKAFSSYDPNLRKFVFEEGYYEISAGLSSEDIKCSCTVYADVVSEYSFGSNTDVKTIYENKQLYDILKGFFDKYNFDWTEILTSYEYTSQDKIKTILSQVNCTDEKAKELYSMFKTVKKK